MKENNEERSKANFFKTFTLLLIGLTIIVGLINLQSLREVRKVEKEFKIKKEILENKKKELDQKNITYDKKFDLEKIRKKMEKKGMSIANDVVFFEVEN